jgi:hypothetical protein
MFGTIRKHQTWLWAVIITLTIISFVVFFSPYSRMNSGAARRRGSYGSINGQVITDQQYVDAYRETDLHSFLNSGRWLSEDRKRAESETERDIYQWLLLVQKQEQLGIRVDDEAAAEMGRQVIGSLARSGVGSPAIFRERLLQPHNLAMADFERYMRHFVGLQELINTIGVSGRLVTPQEAKGLYEREHEELATTAVFFNASNFLATIQPTPDAVTQFYNSRSNNYAIPARVQVSYVRFSVTNFLPQAEAALSTNLNELVEANYQRLGTNLATLFPDAKTPEEARAKIREQLLKQRAMADARNEALQFANRLFDMKPMSPNNLAELAQTNGLTAGVTQPFDREDGPKDIEAGAELTKAAFGLSPDEPYAGPFVGQDGAYIIALNQQFPRQVPSLDQIRPRVESDYKQSQAMLMAWQAANGFYLTLTNGLAQGKSFTNLCAEANLKPVEVPPFSLSTRTSPLPEDLVGFNQLKQVAFTTPVGKLSSPTRAPEGSMMVYVNAKLPVDQTKLQADLPSFLTAVRRNRQQEAFEEWFRREAEKGLRDTPVMQRPPPAMSSTAKS